MYGISRVTQIKILKKERKENHGELYGAGVGNPKHLKSHLGPFPTEKKTPGASKPF